MLRLQCAGKLPDHADHANPAILIRLPTLLRPRVMMAFLALEFSQRNLYASVKFVILQRTGDPSSPTSVTFLTLFADIPR